MAKLCKEDRDKLISYIKKFEDSQVNLKRLQTKIFLKFGVLFSIRAICYYIDKYQNDKWLKKLERDNQLVNNWINFEKEEDISQKIAELTYSAILNKDEFANEELKYELQKNNTNI